MAAFEHVISLLSFVYALGIAHLLGATALLIRNSARVRFSWLHGFYMLNAIVTLTANWISYWDLRALPAWSVGSIMFTFAMAFANYLQAALVCPEVREGEPLDLVAFQSRQRVRIIGSWTLSAAFAVAANAVYGGGFAVSEWSAQNLLVVPMLVVGVAALIWPSKWVQIPAAILLGCLWAIYFAAFQAALH